MRIQRVLFFGTEGDTDEEMYEQLVGKIIRTGIECALVDQRRENEYS